LLVGRLFALLTNFAVQVLIVRYLAKSDFGAFAYALAVVSMGTSIAVLGLNRGVNRFVPIDHERGDYGAVFGTMIVAIGAVAGLGLAIVVLVLGAQGLLGRSVTDDPIAVGLLLILIGLAPLHALDGIFQGLAATFASPRALAVRRYVVGPGLKLAAVLAVVAVDGGVQMLAWCYLGAGLIGVALYVLLLHHALRDQGLLGSRGRVELRVRRLLGFSLPLLSTDIFLTLKVTMAVVLLEAFRGTTEVAELRAVAPVAGLCAVVVQSFKLLFTPLAARLYARNDAAAINDLYWRSAAWITVATFPVFCVCYFLAEPVTVLLFGPRYAGAGVLLAILAAGTYFSAAFGLNMYVLQTYARVRAILAINIAAAMLGLGLNLWLIPLLGAAGAALAITGTVAAHRILVHAALLLDTGVKLFEPRYAGVYLSIGAAIAFMAILQAIWGDSIAVMPAAVAIVSIVLVRTNRRALEISDAFPQLARVPLLRRVIGAQIG
jgi:O-antigen/teichoic acid export membrane protein